MDRADVLPFCVVVIAVVLLAGMCWISALVNDVLTHVERMEKLRLGERYRRMSSNDNDSDSDMGG